MWIVCVCVFVFHECSLRFFSLLLSSLFIQFAMCVGSGCGKNTSCDMIIQLCWHEAELVMLILRSLDQ